MVDSSGESPNGFHLLGPDELPFEFLSLGDIPERQEVSRSPSEYDSGSETFSPLFLTLLRSYFVFGLESPSSSFSFPRSLAKASLV